MIKHDTKLRVIIDLYSNACYQLALDKILYEDLDHDNIGFIRFTNLEYPSLMIGSNQSANSLNKKNILRDKVVVSRRLTRGTTIFPNKYDLNYTIGLKKDCVDKSSYKHIELFEYISSLFSKSLSIMGVPVTQARWKKNPPYKNTSCFCVIDRGEIMVKDGGKIHGGVFIADRHKYLQQGQLLIGTIQDNIDNYVNAHAADACPPMCVNMFNEHIGIEESIEMIMSVLSEVFDIENYELPQDTIDRAEEIANQFRVSV